MVLFDEVQPGPAIGANRGQGAIATARRTRRLAPPRLTHRRPATPSAAGRPGRCHWIVTRIWECLPRLMLGKGPRGGDRRTCPRPDALPVGRASRHQGVPGGDAARLPEALRCRHDLSRRRHRRWLAAEIGWYWPQPHNDVVQKLLRKVRKGTRAHLCARQPRRVPARLSRHRISAASRWPTRPCTSTADGKRYLVIHGDQFDVVVRHARWLALLGDGAYTLRAGRQHPSQRASAGGSA